MFTRGVNYASVKSKTLILCIWGGEAQEIVVTAGWWCMSSLEKFILSNRCRDRSSLWRAAEGATVSRWKGGENRCKGRARTAPVHVSLYFPRPYRRSAVDAWQAGPMATSPSAPVLCSLLLPFVGHGLPLAIALGILACARAGDQGCGGEWASPLAVRLAASSKSCQCHACSERETGHLWMAGHLPATSSHGGEGLIYQLLQEKKR